MRACVACGIGAPAGSSFCGQCGTRLEPETPGLSAHATTALRRSERKVVTVLFADIKGSLAFVAGRDPELAGEIMGVVVEHMTEAIRRHGGVVNQVMGDGIMALFGAPIAMENHAAQACLAALALREAIQTHVQPAVAVRVGLGSGEVVVRALTGDVGLHYSAAGEAVHLASRLEQAAGPDQILLTAATGQLSAGIVDIQARHDIAIKGLDEPLRVFELLRARPGRAGATVRQPRAMVGRDRELALLRSARDSAASGDGRAVRLVGEPGAGKSRLVQEFIAAHLQDGWCVCQADAVPHRRTSYGVVADLLGRLFQLNDADTPGVRRDKIAAALDLPEADAEPVLAPLSALLGLQMAPAGWAALDGWDRRERMIGAAIGAFHRISRAVPVAVVVEDAHWLDAESATTLWRVGATAGGQRLLGLVTERSGQRIAGEGRVSVNPGGAFEGEPEGSPDGSRGAGADGDPWTLSRWTECRVHALDETATASFLESRLLPGPDAAVLRRQLIEHTNGNPLFLEECLQALLETGELVRVGEMVRLDHPVQLLRVPTSLRGLLDARVDRLAETEKDVLQAASVVGNTIPMDLLRGSVRLDDATLARALSRLEQGGFLVERDPGKGLWAFRHGLIREAAYSGILKRGRTRMHGAVLDALERRPGPDDTVVDLLATHANHAEAWPKAVAYGQRAAQRAYDRYANPEAVHLFEQALRAAGNLPESPARDESMLDLYIGVRWPLFRLGDVVALGPHLNEAVRLAAAKPGYEELAQVLVMRSHVHWLRGNPAAALGDIAAAQSLAEQHEDADLAVRARFQRGLVGLSSSDVAGTLADMEAVSTHIGTDATSGRFGLDAHLVVNAQCYTARAHAAAGSLVAARAGCDVALAIAGTLEQRQTKIYAHLADSAVALAEGRPEPALQAAAEADRLCRVADIRLLGPVAAGFLARAHGAAGQAETALPIARQAVLDAERMGFMALQPERLVILAETLMLLGQAVEARDVAEFARTSARRGGEAGAEAAAYGLMGDALAQLGRHADAALNHAAALRLARKLGLAPLVASLARRSAARGAGMRRSGASSGAGV